MANTGFIRTDKWTTFPAIAGVGGVEAGVLYKVEDTWGLPFKSVLEGKEYALVYECPDAELPKAATVVIKAGELCYLQPAESPVTVTNVDGGENIKIGKFVRDAAADDTHARADFRG